jgi:para-aminobenzoate synthetase component I
MVHVIQPFLLSIPWRDPLDALACLGSETGVLGFIGGGSHPLARWTFIMHAPVLVHEWREGDIEHPFVGLQSKLDAVGIIPEAGYGPFQGGWAGLLGYELGRAFEDLPLPTGQTTRAGEPWPDVWLGLYDTVAVFDAHKKRAFIVAWGLDEAGAADKWRAIQKAEALAAKLNVTSLSRVAPNAHGLHATRARDDAQAAIERAVTYIHDGDIFQANISIGFEGVLSSGDTPAALFRRLVSKHPSPFATYLSLGDRAVVSHSPERFLSRTSSGQLETRPIKGTMPRDSDPAIDTANAALLEASVKDRAENLMIVDLMRNDLSRVCIPGTVKVPRLCALESFSTVHHLVSDVIGQQQEGLGFFDALAASFPPGSITGAPKVRAMEIITELEGEPRGPWCGSMIRVGFDGSADSSVLIRTASCTLKDGVWHISARAGAGIVADSQPELEYEEMLTKVRALRVAARGGEGETP